VVELLLLRQLTLQHDLDRLQLLLLVRSSPWHEAATLLHGGGPRGVVAQSALAVGGVQLAWVGLVSLLDLGQARDLVLEVLDLIILLAIDGHQILPLLLENVHLFGEVLGLAALPLELLGHRTVLVDQLRHDQVLLRLALLLGLPTLEGLRPALALEEVSVLVEEIFGRFVSHQLIFESLLPSYRDNELGNILEP